MISLGMKLSESADRCKMLPVELKIRFDGLAPGLKNHRISLIAFHGTFTKLLAALQHTADRVGGKNTSIQRIKIGGEGKKFDLQLKAISDGCVNLTFDVVPVTLEDLNTDEFHASAKKTIEKFIEDVQAVWYGSNPASENRGVRQFLNSLPSGVESQDYTAQIGGEVIRSLSLKKTEQKQNLEQSMLPRLVEFVGKIVSVRFDKPKIVIRDAIDKEHNCQATRELIDLAVDLRHERVAGKMLIRPDLKRLLILRDASQPESIPNQTDRDRHLFEKWGGTLRKLAE